MPTVEQKERTKKIRAYVKRHPEATPKEVVEYFTGKGVPISESAVGYVKYVRPDLNEPTKQEQVDETEQAPKRRKRRRAAHSRHDFDGYIRELSEVREFVKSHGGSERVQRMIQHLETLDQRF